MPPYCLALVCYYLRLYAFPFLKDKILQALTKICFIENRWLFLFWLLQNMNFIYGAFNTMRQIQYQVIFLFASYLKEDFKNEFFKKKFKTTLEPIKQVTFITNSSKTAPVLLLWLRRSSMTNWPKYKLLY